MSIQYVGVPQTEDYGGGHVLKWENVRAMVDGVEVAYIDCYPDGKWHVTIGDEETKVRSLEEAIANVESEFG